MKDSTKIRIRVPRHLYESIQAELNKKGNMKEEYDEKMEEGEEPMNEVDVPHMAQAFMDAVQNLDTSSFSAVMSQLGKAVGMTGKEFQSLLGGVTGIGATAAGLGVAAMKDKKAGIKSTVKQMEEVSGTPDQLAEAIKKVLDKKKAAKEKAAKAEKEKAEKEKAKEKAKKEAEAKKKADNKKNALKEDMKSDFEDWQSGKGPQVSDGFKEIKPDTEVPIGSSLLIKGRNTFFTLEKINGDKYTLSFDMDGDKFTKSRKQLEKYFIFKPSRRANKK